MRALATGEGGFIVSHSYATLSDYWSITIFDNFSSGSKPELAVPYNVFRGSQCAFFWEERMFVKGIKAIFRNRDTSIVSERSTLEKYVKKMNTRRFNTADLKNVLNLFSGHLEVSQKRKSAFKRRFLLSYIFSRPFSLLGEDILIGSVAESSNGHVLGTVFARRFPFGKSWVIGPVLLHPNSRCSGIATHLMNFTVEQLRMKKARLAILSVGKNNIQARRFFEKSDFKYYGSVFKDHDEARKYVQKFTLISGYLQIINHKMGRYAPEIEIANSNQKPRGNQIRPWCIMLRKL